MRYPETFKTAVRAAYPTWNALHDALASGSEMVGRYLDDAAGDIGSREILEATSLEALQERARAIVARKQLYREWMKLYRERNA